MSSPDFPQLFFSNRFCRNLSATVVLDTRPGITIAVVLGQMEFEPIDTREKGRKGAHLKTGYWKEKVALKVHSFDLLDM